MGLPSIPLPKDIVEVGGDKVEVRGLSRAEVIKLQTFNGDMDAVENFVLSCGTGVSEDEAKEWRGAVPADEAGNLIDRIVELSGLTEGASKSGS